ncbi:hypothetical protein AB5N19_12805 [Seiridium cardinale]|uniref:Uncharacterized protein n=1 Tax=Seiridium cardinale TaxID=138064 RepID=A0ABR2Y0B9_9PEZI
MCQFILLHTLCNHRPPQLMAGPFCRGYQQQLMATPGPAFYTTMSNRVPATCEPNARNTHKVSMWCGWECRNDHNGEIERGMGSRNQSSSAPVEPFHGLGEPGAKYGVPRIGVGWRDQ